eukprot:RCo031398
MAEPPESSEDDLREEVVAPTTPSAAAESGAGDLCGGSSSSSMGLRCTDHGDKVGNGVRTFEEAHRVEMVRLMMQAMEDLGYTAGRRALEQESGLMLHCPHVEAFRVAILEGDWDSAIGLLPQLRVTSGDPTRLKFLIFRQKFLELLITGQRVKAVQCAQQQLTPCATDPAALHKLTALVMCKEASSVCRWVGWAGAGGGVSPAEPTVSSRAALLSELLSLISPEQLLPPRRLPALLQQAQAFQRLRCRFHNVDPTDCSLLVDHVCTKATLPKHTRCVLRGHTDEVWFVAFSHNGRLLASA